MPHLPPPSGEEAARSERLRSLIHSEIALRHGFLDFARFMELCLYAPGLGYYEAGQFDADFTTAPELTPLFARSLAKQVAQLIDGGDILEFGAGSGQLALDLMRELEALGKLPRRYLILELSPALVERQKALLAHLPQRQVEWMAGPPERFDGVILANEVLDAMPVHAVAWREGAMCERGVGLDQDRFVWRERRLREGELLSAARKIRVPRDYVSEISLAAPAFVGTLAKILRRGAALLIDYGFPAREYFHPQRAMGTLMCHYKNLAHDDPFFLPGLQDITSHVNFSAIADAGVSAGFDILGYTTQANFLINCGITDLLGEISAEDALAYLPASKAVQRLLSPAEMGELFKVIALGRGIDAPLIGFQRGDKRGTL